MAQATNIFFSNGKLDPWHAGGVLSTQSDSLPTFFVQGGAHHLDLRADHEGDPQSVRDCRMMEMNYIDAWLQGAGSPEELKEKQRKENEKIILA